MATNQIIQYVDGTITEMKQSNGLVLPADYSAGNALNAAYLMLAESSKGPSFLEQMERGQIQKLSVVRALQDMVIQGLTPAKKQGYFIKYGNQLNWTRSYFGAVAIVKRQTEVTGTPRAQVVHKDDAFEIGADEQGRTIVTKFEPDFANLDKPIVGAFAVIDFKDGHSEYTIMTKKEIDQSWSHSKMHGGGPQKEFPAEMAKRTVLNRAAKFVINTSSDNDLIMESVNRTTAQENDFDEKKERKDVTPDEGFLKSLMAEDKQSSPQPEPQPTPNPAPQPASVDDPGPEPEPEVSGDDAGDFHDPFDQDDETN